jgi:hypothetical protein|tara:strand:+ start:1501 stop:2016 length:516 start_codon:yes stop_codon:yes gene_type:complete
MGQEYFINNQILEDKIRQLLPTQGGAGPGFDLSASTQIIPVIDVTESAEGSNLRQDLQRASSINTTTATTVNSTVTVVNTTGYWLCQFTYLLNGSGANDAQLQVTDGTTTTTVYRVQGTTAMPSNPIFGGKELVVRLRAGETLQIRASATSVRVSCSAHQIADISGNLTNT